MTSKTAARLLRGPGRDAEPLRVAPGTSPGRCRARRGPGAAVGAVSAELGARLGDRGERAAAQHRGLRRGRARTGRIVPEWEPPGPVSRPPPPRPSRGTGLPPSSRSGSLCKPEAAFSQPGALRVRDAGSGARSDGVMPGPGGGGGTRGWVCGDGVGPPRPEQRCGPGPGPGPVPRSIRGASPGGRKRRDPPAWGGGARPPRGSVSVGCLRLGLGAGVLCGRGRGGPLASESAGSSAAGRAGVAAVRCLCRPLGWGWSCGKGGVSR